MEWWSVLPSLRKFLLSKNHNVQSSCKNVCNILSRSRATNSKDRAIQSSIQSNTKRSDSTWNERTLNTRVDYGAIWTSKAHIAAVSRTKECESHRSSRKSEQIIPGKIFLGRHQFTTLLPWYELSHWLPWQASSTRLYPAGQWHSNEPAVFRQVSFALQVDPASHSLMSWRKKDNKNKLEEQEKHEQ